MPDSFGRLFGVEHGKAIIFNVKFNMSESRSFRNNAFCVILAPFLCCKRVPRSASIQAVAVIWTLLICFTACFAAGFSDHVEHYSGLSHADICLCH